MRDEEIQVLFTQFVSFHRFRFLNSPRFELQNPPLSGKAEAIRQRLNLLQHQYTDSDILATDRHPVRTMSAAPASRLSLVLTSVCHELTLTAICGRGFAAEYKIDDMLTY